MRQFTLDLLLFLGTFNAFLLPTTGAPHRDSTKLVLTIKQALARSSGSLDLSHVGIIISPKWVLTSLQTFKDYIIAKNSGDLTSIQVSVDGVKIPIENVYFHPEDNEALKAKTAATFNPKRDAALLESEAGEFGDERYSIVVDIIPKKAKDNCYAVGFGKSSSVKPVFREAQLVTNYGCHDFVDSFKEFPDDNFRAAAPKIEKHHVCTKITGEIESTVAVSGGPLLCEMADAGALAFGLAHEYLPGQRITTFVFPRVLEHWIADRTGAPHFVSISGCPDRTRPAIGGLVCLLVAQWLR